LIKGTTDSINNFENENVSISVNVKNLFKIIISCEFKLNQRKKTFGHVFLRKAVLLK